ncbi:MAG: exosortase/archaeosortase family protein [Opitutaceae bacterium]
MSAPLLGWFAVTALAIVWIIPLGVAWKLAPDLGHSWVVPVLMAYLWWERWGERPQLLAGPRPNLLWWLLAVLLVLGHLPLRLLLTPYPLIPSLLAAYAALLAATVTIASYLVAGRAGVRWVAPPLLLTASMLPIPALIEQSILLPTRTFMASLVAEINNLIGQPALAMGTTVRLSNAWLGIDEACGGIRSLQACIMIGLFFGEWFRFGLARRFWLVCMGVAAALAGNLARVLYLSLQAGYGADTLSSVHDPAGWLAMLASLALTGWLACRWNAYRLPEQRAMVRSRNSGASPAWSWVALVALVFLLNEAGTRFWYHHGRTNLPDVPQWSVRFPEKNQTFHPVALEDFAREMLHPGFFAAGRWRAGPGLNVSAYYIEWRQGQAVRFVPFTHNPTVCLPMAGCTLMETYEPIIVHWQHGEIPFSFYKFDRFGEELLVAFTIWDTTKGQLLQSPMNITSRRLRIKSLWIDVREARQYQPAQLLSVTIPMQINGAKIMEQLITDMIQPTRD